MLWSKEEYLNSMHTYKQISKKVDAVEQDKIKLEERIAEHKTQMIKTSVTNSKAVGDGIEISPDEDEEIGGEQIKANTEL